MNSNDVEIQAGKWLARLDSGAHSAADLAAFDQWKASDPRHAAAYARLAATWQALDRIRAIRPSSNELIDNDYFSMASQHSVTDPVPQSTHPAAAPRRRWSLAAAAAPLLVIFAVLWIAHTLGGAKTYTTGIGGFQRIMLADQSTVELNTNSEIRIRLTPQLRKVDLVRGEAIFEVAHDVSRPFIVSAGNMAVRAVGTRFDVLRLENSVEVTVDEGKVAVGKPSVLESRGDLQALSIPQLTAGQSALASGSGLRLKDLPKGDLARKLAWQNQMLMFDGDTLAEVVAQFNRYNERQLVIADPSLATLQIGGYFRPTNLDAFIDVLQSDFGIRVNANGNRLALVTAAAK